MSDLIDRQAAIDAFMKSTSDGDKADWCKWVLKQVPSAQPSQKNDSNTLDALDCVSRKAAIDVLEERLQANGYSNVSLVSELNRCIGYIRRLPSAQPDENMIHLQKEQAYMEGWEDGRRNMPSVQPEQLTLRGWVCPVCGRGLSPYTTVCPCRNGEGWEITCQTKTAT